MANFDGDDHEFTVNGNTHRVRFGAPLRELYIGRFLFSHIYLSLFVWNRKILISIIPCALWHIILIKSRQTFLLLKLNFLAYQIDWRIPNS